MFHDCLMKFFYFKTEYDLKASSFDDLKIKNTTRIEQYGIPLSVLWYPAITKESFFLTFNDQVSIFYTKSVYKKKEDFKIIIK
jgi:hypothetical protein